MKPFIGLKKLWYNDAWTSISALAEQEVSIANLSTWLGTAKEIKNVHEDTWAYEQDDPSVSDYNNELTGKPYYRDVTSNGNKTINFTLGEYSFADRAALQGGAMLDASGAETTTESAAVAWKSPENYEVLYKSFLAQTKTGNFVFFPYASVVAKVDTQEKNLGLGIQATAMDKSDDKIGDEYWIDGEKVALNGNALETKG